MKTQSELFEENIPALTEIVNAAFDRYAKGEEIYITEHEYATCTIHWKQVNVFVAKCFDEAQKRILMGHPDDKPLGIFNWDTK